MRGLLLQTAAALVGDIVRYDSLERLRNIPPVSRVFEN